jgi:outer membrane protein assembly factor BamE (lipoprotein component of BamABCDE complex)
MTTENKVHPIIAMDAIESSQLAAIGHDAETNTLAIQFKSKSGPGSVYHYANFDAESFDAFKNAESIGSHFYREIKPHDEKYPFVKVS